MYKSLANDNLYFYAQCTVDNHLGALHTGMVIERKFDYSMKIIN